jgi:hypothetical protein
VTVTVYRQILDIPGVSDSYGSSIKMMLLKRFSDFKLLRQNLLISLTTSGEGIPPLPTRQVLSMGYDNSDTGYLESRQKYLRNWFNSILTRQSVEGEVYRKTLMEFFAK